MSPNLPGNILRGPRLGQCLPELPRRLQYIIESSAQNLQLTTYRSYSDFRSSLPSSFAHYHRWNYGAHYIVRTNNLLVLVPLVGLFATLSITFGLISTGQGVCLPPQPPVNCKTL